MKDLYAIQVVFPDIEYAGGRAPSELLFTHAEDRTMAVLQVKEAKLETLFPWAAVSKKAKRQIRTVHWLGDALKDDPRYIPPPAGEKVKKKRDRSRGLPK